MVKNEQILKLGYRVLEKARDSLNYLPPHVNPVIIYLNPTITIDKESELRMTLKQFIFHGYDFTKDSNGTSTEQIYHDEVAKLKEDLVEHGIEGNIGWFLIRW